jgi:hypothetical protein
MESVNDRWTSGLFQLRAPGNGIDCTVGYATLTRDALACLTLWLPEGYMSEGYAWFARMYILDNLVDASVEVLFDFREDTGQISREGSFSLPSRKEDDPLYDPEEYGDDEVFAALVNVIRPEWQIDPVEDKTLAQIQIETAAHEPFGEQFANMRRWAPRRNRTGPVYVTVRVSGAVLI